MNKGVRMWCGRAGGVVVTVGVALVALGLTQMVAGTYCMLALPIFQLGSNIWTGSWSGLCGLLMASIGWRRQTMRRGQLVLLATLSVMVADVANIVILQVGENGVFLSINDKQTIIDNNQEYTVLVASWLTTIIAAVGVVISFFGAQYLFCVVVRGPRIKGRMPVTRSLSEEDLQLRQDSHDSTPCLEDVVALPDPAGSSAWVYHPEEDKMPAALYPMGLDLLSDFPDGSRRLPARHASFATSRFARVHQRPQRAQSFATRRDLLTPDGSLRIPQPVTLPAPPGSRPSHYAKPSVRRIFRSNSVSGTLVLSTSSSGATLSRKFHACSLDDLDSAPVIEIGMSWELSRSEHSLSAPLQTMTTENTATATATVQRAASVQERLLDGKTVLTSFAPVSPVSQPVTRIKPKCQAPPPPKKPKPILPPPPVSKIITKGEEHTDKETTKDPEVNGKVSQERDNMAESNLSKSSDTRDLMPWNQIEDLTDSRPVPGAARRVSTLERHVVPLPVIEENIKNTRKRPAPQPCTIIRSQSQESGNKDVSITRPPETSKPARPEIVKPPRPSVADKALRLVDKNTTMTRPAPVKKPERKHIDAENTANLRKLEEVLTNILDHGALPPLRATKSDENIMESLKALDTIAPKSILKNGSTKPSKYEVEHREAIENSRALLDQLPQGELQRNKIVLRVPSYRTAGCQTETYRPVRRRASCAQTNLSVAPRYRDNNNTAAKTTRATPDTWNKPVRREITQGKVALETSSSSSGYSSPEVSSKDPSPAHSGPPSPASSSIAVSDEDERRADTNVTVIEINKSETLPPRLPLWHGLDPLPPPRPPKPLRLRPMSDAATLMSSHGGLLVPVHRRASQIPLYEDVFGLAALSENVMLLTEAINPVLVHSTRPQDGSHGPATTPRIVDVIRKTIRPTSQERTTWDGRTTLLHHSRPALRTHSLSLPRPTLTTSSTQHTAEQSIAANRRVEQGQQTGSDTESTAAYLASLELLASHYRHQALANAKQLQLQQRLLLQQQHQQHHQQHQQQQQQRQRQQKGIVKEEQTVEAMKEEEDTGTTTNTTKHTHPVSPVKQESEC